MSTVTYVSLSFIFYLKTIYISHRHGGYDVSKCPGVLVLEQFLIDDISDDDDGDVGDNVGDDVGDDCSIVHFTGVKLNPVTPDKMSVSLPSLWQLSNESTMSMKMCMNVCVSSLPCVKQAACVFLCPASDGSLFR